MPLGRAFSRRFTHCAALHKGVAEAASGCIRAVAVRRRAWLAANKLQNAGRTEARHPAVCRPSQHLAPAAPHRLSPVPPRRAAHEMSRNKIADVEADVHENIAIMSQTIGNLETRGENLEVLETKSAALQDSSFILKAKAQKVRSNMWWRDARMRVALWGLVVLIAIAVIIAIAAVAVKR
ncbi:synaptobrevin-domain-containing protein [Zopfochytrium polystomum]|nr:synaptobrevin-domain-containing protein [Zopfochytrium polystomum]